MTPKEKSEELFKLFSFYCRECDYNENAKLSALICVDEIIKALPSIDMVDDIDKNYWNEVKQEIQKNYECN